MREVMEGIRSNPSASERRQVLVSQVHDLSGIVAMGEYICSRVGAACRNLPLILLGSVHSPGRIQTANQMLRSTENEMVYLRSELSLQQYALQQVKNRVGMTLPSTLVVLSAPFTPPSRMNFVSMPSIIINHPSQS
jgi:hypothetical protein